MQTTRTATLQSPSPQPSSSASGERASHSCAVSARGDCRCASTSHGCSAPASRSSRTPSDLPTRSPAPARVMPVAAQVRGIPRNCHYVSHPRWDVLFASRTEVTLQCLIWLHASCVDFSERTVPDAHPGSAHERPQHKGKRDEQRGSDEPCVSSSGHSTALRIKTHLASIAWKATIDSRGQ